MALPATLEGGSNTAGKANVSSTYDLFVNPPMTPADAGYVTAQNELDAGQITGSRTLRQPTTSIFNRQSVGIDTVEFSDFFTASTQNTGVWRSAATTFTIAQNAGYLTLNNSSVTTTGAAAIYQTWQSFSLYGHTPKMIEFSDYRTSLVATNQVAEYGLFLANLGVSPYTPTDGVYIRFNSTGVFGVINYNGVETSLQLLNSGQQEITENTKYRIVLNPYRIEFWGASATSSPRQLLGILPIPDANGPPFQSISAPFSIRLYNSGTAGSATQLKCAFVTVIEQDTNQGRPASHIQAGMGLSIYQGQNGGTMGSTALYTNSLAAGAGAVMTNTTAALGSGLGGQFSALPTLAAGTDGIVCSYQNPASTVTQSGRTMFITGVKIQSVVTTVLAGNATPVVYAYSLAYGHSAVSLATAEAVNAKAPRRVALGFESFAAAAAVGTLGSTNGITHQFDSPIVVNPGEFIAIAAKNLGVVTTTGVVTFMVTFIGYER